MQIDALVLAQNQVGEMDEHNGTLNVRIIVGLIVACVVDAALATLLRRFAADYINEANVAILAIVIVCLVKTAFDIVKDFQNIKRKLIVPIVVLIFAMLFYIIANNSQDYQLEQLVTDQFVQIVGISIIASLAAALLVWSFQKPSNFLSKGGSAKQSEPAGANAVQVNVPGGLSEAPIMEDHSEVNKAPRIESDPNRGEAAGIKRSTAVIAVLVFAFCLWLCSKNADFLKGVSPDNAENLIYWIAASGIMALSLIGIFIALWFLLRSMILAAGILLKRKPGDSGIHAGLFMISTVVCLIAALFFYFNFGQYGIEDLLAQFADYGFLVLPIAFAIVVVGLALLIQFVYVILHDSIEHRNVIQLIAEEVAYKLLVWLCKGLNQIIGLLDSIPDFFSVITSGMEDPRVENWKKSKQAGSVRSSDPKEK